LRREIDILSRPTVIEAEAPVEIVEDPPEQVEEKMEEVNGVSNGEEQEEMKNEETMEKEDDMDDEEGLFSSQFNELMDPDDSMGFDSWMNI
jgi:hypothetical protein